MKPMSLNSGVEEKQKRESAECLARLLADTYTLYLKTHNFHWNVTGPMFQTLSQMFEQQYLELAIAVDKIAERIRSLGFPSPGTYQEFARLSSIRHEEGVPAAEEMIRSLVEGHQIVTRTARDAIKVADKSKDETSVDLLSERLQIHEKTVWMLQTAWMLHIHEKTASMLRSLLAKNAVAIV